MDKDPPPRAADAIGRWANQNTHGPRVTVQGLDISEHGMYGYPEQFIPTCKEVPAQ